MSKKLLEKEIEKKLEKLSELLDEIDSVRIIDSDDSETWDSDAFYSLAENLKDALALLEDKKGKQLDEFGEPIILEAGICSLVDDYKVDEDEEE